MSRRQRKKKQQRAEYSAAGQVRRLARALLGAPPAERILPSKKKQALKHKKHELERELDS